MVNNFNNLKICKYLHMNKTLLTKNFALDLMETTNLNTLYVVNPLTLLYTIIFIINFKFIYFIIIFYT